MTKENYAQAKYIQERIDKVETRNELYDNHIAGIADFKWHVEVVEDRYSGVKTEKIRDDVISDYEITKLMEYLDEIREQELEELYNKFEEI